MNTISLRSQVLVLGLFSCAFAMETYAAELDHDGSSAGEVSTETGQNHTVDPYIAFPGGDLARREYCQQLAVRWQAVGRDALTEAKLATELERVCPGLNASKVKAQPKGEGEESFVGIFPEPQSPGYCNQFRCDDALFPDLYCGMKCSSCSTFIGGKPGRYCSGSLYPAGY
jgi:hypothetical protein